MGFYQINNPARATKFFVQFIKFFKGAKKIEKSLIFLNKKRGLIENIQIPSENRSSTLNYEWPYLGLLFYVIVRTNVWYVGLKLMMYLNIEYLPITLPNTFLLHPFFCQYWQPISFIIFLSFLPRYLDDPSSLFHASEIWGGGC